jgi:hypothetical protein
MMARGMFGNKAKGIGGLLSVRERCRWEEV